jgi:hypothetical protein
MSWLRVAFGLLREAAGTQIGQEVIQDIRSRARSKPSGPAAAPAPLNVEALLAEHRSQVDRNLEAVVAMVNEQNTRLTATVRRQRTWNLVLGCGLVIALIAAILAAF